MLIVVWSFGSHNGDSVDAQDVPVAPLLCGGTTDMAAPMSRNVVVHIYLTLELVGTRMRRHSALTSELHLSCYPGFAIL
jgi:hypothetical protein